MGEMWAMVLLSFIALLPHVCPAPIAHQEGKETNIMEDPSSAIASTAIQASSSNTAPAPNPSSKRLLIAVVSAPSHENAREAIRRTWASVVGRDFAPRMDVRFFVGQLKPDTPDRAAMDQRLTGEQGMVRFHDFVEDYHNLTAKALGIFRYAYQHDYAGVMKVDDDTYIRPAQLLAFLDQFPDWSTLYAGEINKNVAVGQNPGGRWYSYDQYPHERWPTYCNGPGFFLGKVALEYISLNREKLLDLRVDDAAVGVWTEPLNLNIQPMPHATYPFEIPSNVPWITPVNYSEAYLLHEGQRVTLQACQVGQDTACLCAGTPYFSWEEIGACWAAAGDAVYEDKIPRLHAV